MPESSSSMTYEDLSISETDPEMMPRLGAYKSVVDIFANLAEIFKRPDRLSVTDVAERYVVIKRLGARTGHWNRTDTPYMIEPQNLFSSRELSAIIFAGPAQSGKTEALVLNCVAYSIIQDPMDMIIFNPTQQNARDFSVRRIDRMNMNSPAIRERLMRARATDNKAQKQYASGMILNLSWPTVSEMAGKPVGRVILTDYDRMDDTIGDEGSPFDLAFMRTTTFHSFAMTVAESSPSRPITDPRWIASSPHQAPPTGGILALYNRGDMRRWYWPCWRCGVYFEGKFSHLKWEDKLNILDAADTVRMICPTCGHPIKPDAKHSMQEYGVWLKDGQFIRDGKIHGAGPRSRIASFWLNGVAAGFQSWQELVIKFLNATKEYEETGSEEALKQFSNNDLGEPYKPKAEELERLPEVLQSRAEALPKREVPYGVRFLVAAIDVQKNMFKVQVHGICPGVPADIVIVDRFDIIKSTRIDDEGDKLWVKPGTNQEDWDLIISEVMKKTYPLQDTPDKEMMVKLTVCDSGGQAGVTTNAYEFYRKLKKLGLAGRFHLVKGEPRLSAPRTYIDFPDQKRKDRLAAARGDVPVLFLNSNILKDALSNRLDSLTPGKGTIRFPDWLEPWFYKELCAERRDEKGWHNTQGVRNEAWDLLYYTLGACASPLLKVEHIDWLNPPTWAGEWAKNPLVSDKGKQQALTSTVQATYDFSSFGKTLA